MPITKTLMITIKYSNELAEHMEEVYRYLSSKGFTHPDIYRQGAELMYDREKEAENQGGGA